MCTEFSESHNSENHCSARSGQTVNHVFTLLLKVQQILLSVCDRTRVAMSEIRLKRQDCSVRLPAHRVVGPRRWPDRTRSRIWRPEIQRRNIKQCTMVSYCCSEYSKPSLIQLQLIRMSDDPNRNMKNAVYSWVHTIKDTWHLGRQMSHLSVHTKLAVSSKLHYYVQKQAQLLSLLSMNKCIVFL
jgi:hypothetical protein